MSVETKPAVSAQSELTFESTSARRAQEHLPPSPVITEQITGRHTAAHFLFVLRLEANPLWLLLQFIVETLRQVVEAPCVGRELSALLTHRESAALFLSNKLLDLMMVVVQVKITDSMFFIRTCLKTVQRSQITLCQFDVKLRSPQSACCLS